MLEESVMEFTRYVGDYGRITVPHEIRRALRIRDGDLVEITIRKVNSPDSSDAPRRGAWKKGKE